MKGFIVYQTYRIIDGNTFVCLFGRLENGQNFLTMNYYKPYFYIELKDLDKALKVENFEYEKTNLTNFNKEAVVKVFAKIPKEVPNLRKSFEEEKVECFEADIPFTQRFLIDMNIQGSLEIEGEYTSGGEIDRFYKEPELKSAVWKPKLKVLSIDIETSRDVNELYCIALACESFRKVLINSKKKKLKNAILCSSEEGLLEKFKELVLELDPDIITGWHVIDFDLKVLFEKFKNYGISFVLGRDNTPCKLRIETDFFRTSKADFPGRMVLDGIDLMKISFVKLDNYKLDTAAKTLIGKRKLLQLANKSAEIERIYKKDQQKLVNYNLKDAELVLQILEKSKVLNLTIQRSLLTGMGLDKVSASIASFDSLYFREAKKRNLVLPSRSFRIKEKKIKGGFVMEPEPGIYDNILVLDFKSLYPSIIRTFNIDPSSYVPSCKGKNLIKAPNKACFRNEEGILPSIIQKLWQARNQAKKEKNELASYAIKILMNSFFGVMATPNCRFFNLKIANAITHFGQAILKLTAKKIRQKGYEVIYGDTDAAFVVSKAKNLKEAKTIGKKLQEEINKFYKDYIKKKYKRESFLELEFEKCFTRFLMPKLRKESLGAKKRYAGIVIKKGKENLEVTGLEAIRGDWTELAKKFQLELLHRVFHKKKVDDYIKSFVKELKKGKFDNRLIYRKSIRKDLNEYIKTTPPHVKAARKLEKLESNLIEYVITEEGPEPIQNVKHKINYKHYIQKQIKPIADSILTFFDKNFEELMEGSKQTTLTKY